MELLHMQNSLIFKLFFNSDAICAHLCRLQIAANVYGFMVVTSHVKIELQDLLPSLLSKVILWYQAKIVHLFKIIYSKKATLKFIGPCIIQPSLVNGAENNDEVQIFDVQSVLWLVNEACSFGRSGFWTQHTCLFIVHWSKDTSDYLGHCGFSVHLRFESIYWMDDEISCIESHFLLKQV